MHPIAERFLDEIRQAPEFIVAVERDPATWKGHLAAVEDVLHWVYDKANTLPAAQEVFDLICGEIGDQRRPLKTRILVLMRMLAMHPAVRTRNSASCGP